MTISAAELRARIDHLGLTPAQFATIAHRDERGIRRQATGTTPVTPSTLESLWQLEHEARAQLARFDRASEDGTPIILPRYPAKGGTPETSDRPASWWHAIAGRHIDKWGEDAQIEYGAPGADEDA